MIASPLTFILKMVNNLSKYLLELIDIVEEKKVVDGHIFGDQKSKNLAKSKVFIKLSKFHNISTNIEATKFLTFKTRVAFTKTLIL